MKIDGEFLSNLRFADDIFLCAETPQELQQILQERSDEHRKDKGDGFRHHPYQREQCADRKYPMLRVLWTTLQPEGKEPVQRDSTKNHGRLGGIRRTPGYLQKQPCHLPEETGVQLLCAASYDIWCRDLDTDQTSIEQNWAAHTEMERSMLKITYKYRRTNIWVRERTKVIYIYNVHCEKNEMVLGRAYQPPQRQPLDLACHHLETI